MDPFELLTQFGLGGGLVGLSVWLIYTGRLVPRATYQEARNDRDAWKEAYEKQRDINVIQTSSFERLSKGLGDTVTHTLNSLPLASNVESNGETNNEQT